MDDDPVTVVWCDFGGVLTPPIAEAIRSMVDASGVPWGALEGAIDAVASELGVRGLGPLELGMLAQADWAERVLAHLAPEHAPAVDLRRWDEYWYRDREPNRELLDELDALANRGIRIGLLTNSVLEWEPQRARMLAGRRPFDGLVRSHELGIAKPDPLIFEHADRVLPPRGGRVVLVDDLARNCAAAQKHGWLAVHHLDTSATVSALRALVA